MTLGIPRLRELLMTAAQSIKTPIMTLPLLATCNKDDANALANRLRRLSLAEARLIIPTSFTSAVMTCFAAGSLEKSLHVSHSVWLSGLLQASLHHADVAIWERDICLIHIDHRHRCNNVWRVSRGFLQILYRFVSEQLPGRP